MAEEEAGFTFVDKRRVSSEAAPADAGASAIEHPSEAPEPTVEETGHSFGAESEADDPAAGAPSTYDLLGYCINLLAQQAWQKLGLLADPQTGEAQLDLVEAKVAIDTVGDLAARLESAPESAVPGDLRRELRTLVNDLRLNYVSRRGQNGGVTS